MAKENRPKGPAQRPKGAGAQALMRAGYVRLPPLYVTWDQLETIIRMAEGNKDVVNEIRGKANRGEKDE